MGFLIVVLAPFFITLFWGIVFILHDQQSNKARFGLGIFMFFGALLYFCHALYYLGYHEVYQKIDFLYTFSSLSVFPMYYWYVKLLTCETQFRLQNIKHLVPAVLLSLTTLVLHLNANEEARQQYFNRVLINNDFLAVFEEGDAGRLALAFYSGRLVFEFQIFLYIIKGFRLAHNYNVHIANFYSNLKDRQLIWVKLLSVSFFITAMASLIFNIIGRGVFYLSKEYLVIPAGIFSVLMFVIGLQGNQQNYTIKEVESDEMEDETPVNHVLENREKLKERLLVLMEQEALFRKHDLRISVLCKKLNTNRTYISGIINDEFGESFNAFVNRYRVKHACDVMKNEAVGNYSLDYLAHEAGFGSASSFMRAFKQIEGITPGKYLRQISENGQQN